MTEPPKLPKRSTGIPGLDEMTYGGLPASGVTLLAGGTGSGKTVAAHAVEAGQGAIFASFEESEERLRTSAAAFSWGAALNDGDRVRFIDARPPVHQAASGSFDLSGLIASLQALAEDLHRPWIVLDGIDQLLAHQPAALAAAQQLVELDTWSARANVPIVVTGKVGATVSLDEGLLGAIEFLVPTSIRLSTRLVGQHLARRLRIVKYRGSAHVIDEVPMVMDDDGVHLPYGASSPALEPVADRERIGTGIPRLDQVLGGGPYRGTTTLISGAPGTAKTTLAASIAEAAAERGETAVYVTFDEGRAGVIRNAASVGIDLATHIEAGRLRLVSMRSFDKLADEHFLRVHGLLEEARPDLLVIDPVSALFKEQEDETSAYLSVERILGVTRARGVTTVLTSLLTDDADDEGTRSRASTLADTWISLDYRVARGERNRALSVVKSRGTAHSNQVRELILDDAGVDLADVYPYGSEVLMGTARLHEEQQRAERLRAERTRHEENLRALEESLQDVRDRREEATREERRLAERLENAQKRMDELDGFVADQGASIRSRRLPPGRTGEPERRFRRRRAADREPEPGNEGSEDA
jgi:circadian clock protein KaiC